ncbi:MAG: transporter, partial [Pyrinomonadaceae bacterium]
MSVKFTFLFVFLNVVLASAAFAQQRPLITDDIDITPEGAFEIAAGVEFLQNVKFPLSGLKGDLTRVGDLRLRSGFASNVELQIEATLQNFLAINSQSLPSPIPLNIDGNSSSDFGDIITSVKIKLLNEGKNTPGVGLKLGFQIPSTDQAR